MDLYAQILAELLSNHKMEISFPELRGQDLDKLIEGVCFDALRRIRDIVRDDSVDDPECFDRIEAIVTELERVGSDGGTRHDFG